MLLRAASRNIVGATRVATKVGIKGMSSVAANTIHITFIDTEVLLHPTPLTQTITTSISFLLPAPSSTPTSSFPMFEEFRKTCLPSFRFLNLYYPSCSHASLWHRIIKHNFIVTNCTNVPISFPLHGIVSSLFLAL